MKRNLVLLAVAMFFLNDVDAGVKAINPVPLFLIEGIGNGYSAPAVTSSRVFVTGELEGTGFLFAYDTQGSLLWKSSYGREWAENFRGSRASPVVADTMVYTCSGLGDIACFGIQTGKKLWEVNMIEDLHGVNAVFGYSMPVLIENDRIYCLPGGPDTNIVCLNRFSGEIIWISGGNGETPGYTSPLVIRHHDRKLLVTFSEMALLGLDAETGALLWTYELSLKGNLPCNQPIYAQGFLYIVAGSGNGAVKLELLENGSQIQEIWRNPDFDTYFGGFVMIGNFLYGSADKRHLWWSIDANTGKVTGSLSFGTGATSSEGKNLVLYNQSGKVGIVRPDNGKMTLVNSFLITKGTSEHFAPPLVAGGRLFIRHGNALLVYDYQELLNL